MLKVSSLILYIIIDYSFIKKILPTTNLDEERGYFLVIPSFWNISTVNSFNKESSTIDLYFTDDFRFSIKNRKLTS